MIYTFGDSHSNFGWCNIDNVKINWLGPKLMYNLKESDFKLKDISNDDFVVFCYGEIDVRCHIEKHVVNGNYEKIIKDMCENYIDKIINIKKEHNLKNVLIYNILPTRRVDTKEPYEITCKTYQTYNPVLAQPYPFIGSDIQRKNNTILFNNILKKMSTQNNLGFIDVYDKYTDQDGYLDMNLSDGTVHIDNEIYLKEYLKNNL